ncbi:MAG TPA: single-stranded DNA-binding protein, partial [Leptospiraceae bacterium]|nr:single-stranded DNA-binding protein [Leptospiraceae bacterium]
KQGEYCESRLKKGNPVIVWGRMKQERWKSSDGTSRQKMKIVAEDVRLLEREKSESKNEEREQRKAA